MSDDCKFVVVCYDEDNSKSMGTYFKKSWKEAVDFGKKVSSNGFYCYIYENKPIETYKPRRR